MADVIRKAVITISERASGEISVSTEFDPPVRRDDPPCVLGHVLVQIHDAINRCATEE